ncbi:Helicase associated domain protein [Alphaproteobacteria bacterium LSUCC0744]
MSSFDQLLSDIRGQENYGKHFEVFCKWFLENDPAWSKTVAKVWLWDEYPNKWQRKDLGTDLVFEDKRGRIWAVQSKCYEETHSTTKNELNSFLADTSRKVVYRRLWMQSNSKMGDNALSTLHGQEKPVTILKLHDFRNANLDYPALFNDLRKAKAEAKPKPDPHQVEAIEAVVSGLKTSDRGQMIMACGTGKTFTTLWIKEALNARATLVLLPSLNLLSQTMREWAWGAKDDFDILNVCSDKSVGKKTEDMGPSEAPFPVTSEVSEIAAFLKRPANKVLFCTYQSSALIAEVQKDKSIPSFDLAIADEAHRCAGKSDAGFSTILDAAKIRSAKRLFTTATPRYFGKAVKDAAKLRDAEIIGMDNEELFGPVVHKLTFGEAIQRDLLNDYQVVVVGVDEPRVKLLIDNYELVSSNPDNITDARTLAAKVGLIKAIRDYDLKRVISFHSRVTGAKAFSSEFTDVVKLIKPDERPEGLFFSDYVEGKMKASDRADKIQQLKSLEDYDRGVLSNARCLAEGVDVPSLDGIAFIDPRGSRIEIIQAVGRAIRKVRNATSQSKGTIVIPVFIEEGDSPEASIEASNFKPVWDVLNALRAHDEILAETLDEYRRSLAGGKRSTRLGIARVAFDLPSSVGAEFADALRTVVVEASSSSWHFGFAKLQQYKEENGDCLVPAVFRAADGYFLGQWVQNQRKKKHRLFTEKVSQLDTLGFVWDPLTEHWEEGLQLLKQYKEENGDFLVPRHFVTPEGFKLGNWTRHQRRTKDELTQERVEQLDAISFSWAPITERWRLGIEALDGYKAKYGDCRVPQDYCTNSGFKLGVWVVSQAQRWKSLTEKQRDELTGIGFVWHRLNDSWEEGFQTLERYKKEYGDCLVPNTFQTGNGFRLGRWVATQRKIKDRLSQERLKRLIGLGFSWDPLNEDWESKYQALIKYKEEHGDCLVALKFTTEGGVRLGAWVIRQRMIRSGLSSDRIKLLDDIGFVWDPLHEKWKFGLSKLQCYKKEHGDLLVPTAFKTKDDFKLGAWVSYLRTRKNKLPPDRVKQLDEIGFVWHTMKS